MTNTISIQWEANECPRTVRPVGGVADPPEKEAIDVAKRTRSPDPLQYDPHRVFDNEPHVLVFTDVSPSDWHGEPEPIGVGMSEWATYAEGAAKRRDELHTMPYAEYLKTPEWMVTRKIVKQRAGYRCERCSRPDTEWNVHHLTYERRGYEDLNDLVLLCRRCHEIEHGIGA